MISRNTKVSISDGWGKLIDLVVQQLWGNTERISKSGRCTAKIDYFASGVDSSRYHILEFSAEFVEVLPQGPGS